MLGFPAGPCARRRCSEPRAGGRRYGGGRHRVTLKLRRTGRTPMPDDVSGPNRFARDLFGPLPARYDRLAEVLSFGQNGRWRRAMIGRAAPAAGDAGLDVASGTAGVGPQMAARSGASIVGVDLTEQMLRQGQRNVAGAGASDRVRLAAGRAEQLPFADATFDALTF